MTGRAWVIISRSSCSPIVPAGAGFRALDVLALAVMCAGIVILVRSPLIGGMSAAASDEYLGAGGDIAGPGAAAPVIRSEKAARQSPGLADLAAAEAPIGRGR